MKHVTQTPPRRLLQALTLQGSLIAAILTLGGVTTANAQTTVVKANSYTSLTTGGDWVGSTAPGANNIAVWNSTVPGADSEALGANTAWDGIQILNPGGAVTITADGNALTNGAAGINLLTASQSLTMSNILVLNGPQYWQVGNNQTLSYQGALQRPLGGAIMFSFDNSSAAAYMLTNNGTIVTNNMAIMDGNPGTTTGTGVPYATYNDVDFAALSQPSGQVVPLATFGYSTDWGATPIYLSNPSASTPTFASGTAALFYDFTNTADYGARVSTTTYVQGFRFNTHQTTNAYTYNGVDAWQVLFKSGNVLDVNSILVTTNVGNSPVVFTSGGSVRLSTAAGAQDMTVFQNNPAANLIFQSPITGRAAGQLVSKFGVGTMELQAACTYSAGTLIYGGTVLVDATGSVGVGAVQVYSGGTFEGSSSAAINAAPVTINNGGTQSAYISIANGQFNNNTNLTFNTGTTYLDFIYSNSIAPSTTKAALLVTNGSGSLTLNGTINVLVASANLTVGQFPLVSYTGTVGGAGFAALSSLTLPPHTFGYLSNNTANSSIDLVITNVDQPLTWNTGSGNWDINVTSDWLDALNNSSTYQQIAGLGDNVLFNDAATGPSITVTLNTNVAPLSVVVSNAANTYTISGTGSIGGLGSLTKNDSGTLTLSTANSFSSGINLNGGTVIFSALNNLGSGAVNFNGGTLQYNGNSDDISPRTVTFLSGGATINTAGQTVSYANPVGNGGAGGLTKAGTGTLTLNGTQTYHGNTVVSQGTLALATNTDLTNSSAIIVNSGAVLDTATGGVNLTLNGSVSQTLEGSGQVNGVVTAPTTSGISPSGGSGQANTTHINGALAVSGGTLTFDVAATSNDVIAVTGPLTLNSGVVQLNVNGNLPFGRYVLMTYSGTLTGTAINLGSPFGFSQVGAIPTLDSSVTGQIALVISPGANNNITWAGTSGTWDLLGEQDWLNTSTPWAYTNGDAVTFNDAAYSGYTVVSLAGDLLPASITVSNTAISAYTFVNGGGAITAGLGTTLLKEGTGSLIMETPNNYNGWTTIANGTVQLGNGGTTVGDIGLGNITNNGSLVFAEGDGANHMVHGVVSGTGSLLVNATATIIVTNNNTYTGSTTISNGTLQVGGGLYAAGSLGTATSILDDGALVYDRLGTITNNNTITGTGSFGTSGGGVVAVGSTASLTYQGSTVISGGTLKLDANNQLPSTNSVAGSTGVLNLGGSTNGTLDLNGFSVTVNNLVASSTLNGIVTNSGTSTTTTNILADLDTSNETFDAVIMDHGTTGAKTLLEVLGPGVLTMDPISPSLWTGGMIVSNSSVYFGTVSDINGSLNSAGNGPMTLLGTNTTVVMAGGQTGANNGNTYNSGTNIINLPANQTASIWGPPRGDISNPLIGAGTLYYYTIYVRGGIDADWSAYTGTIIVAGEDATADNLGFGVGTGLPHATLDFNTNVDFHAGSLNAQPATGSLFPIGALEGGDNSSELQGTSSGNAKGVNVIFEVGGLNTSTAYGGGIIDGNGLLKVGTGTLTLNDGGVIVTNVFTESDGFTLATNVGLQALNMSYTGTTTVSNGVLKLCAPVEITNSTTVTIASASATLDASSMGYQTNIIDLTDETTNTVLITNSIFEVTSNTLGGIGTLNGFVLLDPTGKLNVGLPTGTFNVTSNATLAGAVTISLDNTDAPVNGELVSPGITISGTATLLVTNLGPTLTNGTTYTLFNQGVSGFASTTLPSGYVWSNSIASSGSITVISGGISPVTINPNPTNIVFSATANPGSITLSWPGDHTGWWLQSQTNTPGGGITGTWYNVAGSTATDQIVVPFIPTDSVFYRLVYTNTP